jgi:hypothetical protein
MNNEQSGSLFGKSRYPTKMTSAGTKQLMQTKIGLKKLRQVVILKRKQKPG